MTLVHALDHHLPTGQWQWTSTLWYLKIIFFLKNVNEHKMQPHVHVLSRTRKCDHHVIPKVIQLYWLPNRQRNHFKMLFFTWKSLHGLAPPCIYEPASHCILCSFPGYTIAFFLQHQEHFYFVLRQSVFFILFPLTFVILSQLINVKIASKLNFFHHAYNV